MSPLSAPPCKQLSAESRGEREPKRGTFNVTRTVDQRKGHACVSEGLPQVIGQFRLLETARVRVSAYGKDPSSVIAS